MKNNQEYANQLPMPPAVKFNTNIRFVYMGPNRYMAVVDINGANIGVGYFGNATLDKLVEFFGSAEPGSSFTVGLTTEQVITRCETDFAYFDTPFAEVRQLRDDNDYLRAANIQLAKQIEELKSFVSRL